MAGKNEKLTVREVAEELGLSAPTVRKLIDKGDLIAYRVSDRRLWVRRKDLDEYLEECRSR